MFHLILPVYSMNHLLPRLMNLMQCYIRKGIINDIWILSFCIFIMIDNVNGENVLLIEAFYQFY